MVTAKVSRISGGRLNYCEAKEAAVSGRKAARGRRRKKNT